jgi:hypothetical protein
MSNTNIPQVPDASGEFLLYDGHNAEISLMPME